MDGEKENMNGDYKSEDTDDDGPIVEYFRRQGPYVQPASPIPEDWVQGRIAVPLTQLTTSNQVVRMVNEAAVNMIEDCILQHGYIDTRYSVTVRALPRNADSEPPEQVYEVLDGHHRVAALRALQTRNLCPKEYALPVTVLRGHGVVGHTHEHIDHVFARVFPKK